jgi:hypothetical protein
MTHTHPSRAKGRMNTSLAPRLIFVAALISLFANGLRATSRAQKDQHRPACNSASCQKVKFFLKAHYCGESPFGNGPDDGCEIKAVRKPQTGVDVIADYNCEWNENKQAAQCEQHGQPSPAVRNILVGELQRLGLPVKADGQTYFTVWKSAHSGWSIAVAYYSGSARSDLELCEVIVMIDESSHALVLRKLPYQKTDVDVPIVTQWAPVDLADVNGDGHEDIVLEGDAYENHWLEVVSVRDGSAKTIFSGLGYYL